MADDQYQLLADLFELHTMIPDGHQDHGLSSGACSALTDICRRAGRDLSDLRDSLSADLLNWTPAQRSRKG